MSKLKIFLLLIFFANEAQASLVVTPSRVEFDDENLSQVKNVRLSNSSDVAKTYRISLQHLKMKESGEYLVIKGNNHEEKFADDIIVYSPKRVLLLPKSSQTIRIMAKKPQNLASGEYRSHLLISEESESSKENNAKAKQKNISVSVKALLSMSIPIIVNSGKKTGKAEISNMLLRENNLLISFLRKGNSSIYGDLIINLIDSDRKTHEVGLINGISLLYPYQKRNYNFDLKIPKNIDLEGSRLEAVLYSREYKNESYVTNKDLILSKKIIELK